MNHSAGSGTSPSAGKSYDDDPRAPSRIPFGTSAYTKRRGRLFNLEEIKQIASLFQGNASQQQVMDELNFRGNFEAFRLSLEKSGYILVRKLEPCAKKKNYTKKPELSPAELALIQEVFMKPHSIHSAATYLETRIGRHVSTATRLLHSLERSGFTYRNALLEKSQWEAQLNRLKEERRRLEGRA